MPATSLSLSPYVRFSSFKLPFVKLRSVVQGGGLYPRGREQERLGHARELQLVDEVRNVQPLAPAQLLQEDPPAVKVQPFRTPEKKKNIFLETKISPDVGNGLTC